MKLLNDLLETLPEGEVLKVRIGVHWTAVVVDVNGEQRCGLASTLRDDHKHHGEPEVPEAGSLEAMPGLALAGFAASKTGMLASVGAAALNALLPKNSRPFVDINAEHVIAEHGAGKRVSLVGNFPFVPRLRQRVGHLDVIERDPEEGDLPEEAAPEILPQADVVAITGMSLINHTLENLLGFCSPNATVIVLGPSTPLSPVLFDYGVNLLSGSVVTDIDAVVQAVTQGANFRQIHRKGVRLVTISSPDFS